MEAVNELGLTTLQLEQINVCRMFLQITTLAEITDHMGRHLFPQALIQAKQDKPEGLGEISESNLEWPTVGNPSKPTWTFWTKTISTLFTGAAKGTQLRQPLGAWKDTYQIYRFWKWRMAATGQLLHRRNPTSHPRAAIQLSST